MRLRRWAPLLLMVLILGLVTPVLPASAADAPPPASTLPVPLPANATGTALGVIAPDGSGHLSFGGLPAGDYNVLLEMPGGDPVGYRIVDDAPAAVQVSQEGGGPAFAIRGGEAIWQHVQVPAGGSLSFRLQAGPKVGPDGLVAVALPVPEVDGADFSGLSPYAGHKSTVAVRVATAGLYAATLRVGGNVLTLSAAGTTLNAVVSDEQSPDTLYLPEGVQEISLNQTGGGRPWRVAMAGPTVTALPVLFDSQVRSSMPAAVAVNLGNTQGAVQARVSVFALGLAGTQLEATGGPVNLKFTIGNSGSQLISQNVTLDAGTTLQMGVKMQLAGYVRQVCGPVCDQRLTTFVLIFIDNADSYAPPVLPDLPSTPAFNPESGAPNEGWYTSDVTFGLTGTSDALAHTDVSADGLSWVPYEPGHQFTLTADGTYDLYWRTHGLTGNGELPNLVTIKISKQPPLSKADLSSPTPQNADGSYNAPVQVTFHAYTAPATLAPGSGLFSLDGFQSTAYDLAQPMTFWTPGTYTLTVRAVDSAGAAEQPYEVKFTIAGERPAGGGTYALTTVGDVPAGRIPTLQRMLERAWEQDTNVLGFTPTTPIMVEFVANREDWNWQLLADGDSLSTVSIVTGAGGITTFGGGHIEIPLDKDPTTEPADGALDDGDLQNTVSHEMFHAILGKAGNDQQVPTWANEGTAWQNGNVGQLPFTGGGQPYAAGSFLSARNTILGANQNGGFVPLSDIDVLASFWNTEAYSYLAIARLEQKLGADKWVSYLQAAAAGKDNALKANLGLSQKQVDDDLRAWVKQQSQLAPGIGRVSLRLLPALGPASVGFTASGSGSGGVDTGRLDPGDYTFYVQQDGTVWGPPGTTYTAAQHTRDYDRLTVTITPKDLTYQGKRLTHLDFYLRQSYGQWYMARYRLFFDDGTALAGPFQAGADLSGLVRLNWIDTLDAGTLATRDADVITLGITSGPPALDLRNTLRLDGTRATAAEGGLATITGTTQPGAAVWGSGLGPGTHADATGHFSLKVPVESAHRALVFAALPVPLPPASATIDLVPGAAA